MPETAAITGIGVVTPVGLSTPASWQAMLSGACGIRPIASFAVDGYRIKEAGEVPAGPDRLVHAFAESAIREAVADAKLPPESLQHTGLIFGSNLGEIGLLECWCADESSPLDAFPLFVTANRVAPEVRGPRIGLSTACATGANALGLGLNWIRLGRARTVIAGASDILTPFKFGGHHALGSLASDGLRPFDRRRSGTLLGEGAAFLVLEHPVQARVRGVRIYAELCGFGASADAHHLVAPDPTGRGQALAISRALADARVSASAVDYINAHGTGTPANDRAETAAIRLALGTYALRPLCVSTKGFTGHMLGASAAAEAAFTAMAIASGQTPPTRGLEEPDPACDLRHVMHRPVSCDLAVAISNSFGFGGNNSCLVFRQSAGGGSA